MIKSPAVERRGDVLDATVSVIMKAEMIVNQKVKIIRVFVGLDCFSVPVKKPSHFGADAD